MENTKNSDGETSVNQETAMFWASVVARAWEDPNFKKLLLKNTMEALKEMGFKEFRSGSCDGERINFKATEAEDFKPFDFDPSTNTMTINLPKSPEGFETLKFTGIFGSGICT